MPNDSGDEKDRLLDAALTHVPFDGWSEKTFRAAIRDTGLSRSQADMAIPRGPVDLALAFHERGDRAMIDRLRTTDLSAMRFRDKVATAVRFRIEAIADREAARRASTFFALPQHAAEGARALWGTADAIWEALGDPSDDINWYTKRATLSGVYGSTVLYWLGDESLGSQNTWAFIDRRIDNVMQIEKAKGTVNSNPILRRLFAGPAWIFGRVKAPRRMPRMDLPGHFDGEASERES